MAASVTFRTLQVFMGRNQNKISDGYRKRTPIEVHGI